MNNFEQLKLESERFLLEPLTESDAKDLYSIHADPDVMKFWSSLPWTKLSQAKEMICKDLIDLKIGKHLRLGVKIKDEEKVIGTVSLFAFSEQNKRAEIGYVLAKEYWGRGLMYEATSILVDFAFNQLDLIRIEADIHPDNQASARILERLGFQKEGFLRDRWIVEGEISDSFIYGLLRKEWEQG